MVSEVILAATVLFQEPFHLAVNFLCEEFVLSSPEDRTFFFGNRASRVMLALHGSFFHMGTNVPIYIFHHRPHSARKSHGSCALSICYLLWSDLTSAFSAFTRAFLTLWPLPSFKSIYSFTLFLKTCWDRGWHLIRNVCFLLAPRW